jgi:site-specific recombinase XerD
MATFKFYLDKPFIESPEAKEQIKELKKKKKEILSSLLSDSETAIYLYVIVDRKTIKLRTQERILPKHWNFNQQTVRKSHSDSANFNIRIRDFKIKIVNLYDKHLKENEKPTVASIRNALQNHNIEKNISKRENTFFEVYDAFITFQTTHLKELTVKKYNTLKKHLAGFEAYLQKNSKQVFLNSSGSSTIEFNSIDKDFILEFQRYLANEKKQLNDTMVKYLECLKYFLNWSFDRNIHKNEIFKEIDIKRTKDKNDKVYLTPEEFYKIYDLDLSGKPGLSLARDMFCFQTLTGQRVSDITNIKWEDITSTENGKEWGLYQIKGNKEKKINVPVFDPAEVILDRYASRATKGKIFPYIANPTLNKYVKDIAKLAGINEEVKIRRNRLKTIEERTGPKYEFVTTHTARISFVTISLEQGMRPEIVMSITGHEDYKTMKIYQQLIDKVKHQEAKAIWNRPNMKIA